MARIAKGLSHKQRVMVVLCGFLAVGTLIIARLAQMQLICRELLDDYNRTGLAPGYLIETTRGTIYTRDGKVLARDVPVFDLCVEYDRLADEKAWPDWQPWVADVFDMSAADLTELQDTCRGITARVEHIARWVKAERGYDRIQEQNWHHPVVKNITPEVAALLKTGPDRCPEGLKAVLRGERVYPKDTADLAPHIIGRCRSIPPRTWQLLQDAGGEWTTSMAVSKIGKRYRIDDTIGVGGIEEEYEGRLRGRRGYAERRIVFRTLRVERFSTGKNPELGQDVYLTLRTDLQEAANESLQWAAAQPGLEFKSGAIVVLDVRDGAVLAASTYPSYDPNNREEMDEELKKLAPFLFRPTQAALPTGSVYKLVTAIAALEEGKIDAYTTFHCAGSQRFAGQPFACTGSHRTMTLVPAMEKSCNVFFYNTGVRVGGPALARWGKALGMGVATHIDLPSERSGQNPEPTSLHGTVNLSIGQGPLLCTPMQVARMCAAIANGGTLVQPHFFERAVGPDGEVAMTFEPTAQTTVRIRPETLRLVREGMHRAVQSGTAKGKLQDRFDAAGKTGTAQLQGTPLNHAWFAGYAPFDDPKIAFAVVSELDPGHGGRNAAPIMDHLLDSIWAEVEAME